MRAYRFDQFGIDHLRLTDLPTPTPGPGQALVSLQALSLNYRDLLVVTGGYNPRLRLPATPISDGAGVVAAVGPGVTRVRVGDRVMSHFIAGWIEGPFRAEYRAATLGTPGPGLAAEQVCLPAEALLPLPAGYDFAQAATLPIAALTAWSALVTEGRLAPRQTVLTLGTGGVSIFALQLAKALGARVIITSHSDAKLTRARELGADYTINYATTPDWPAAVLAATDNQGADVVVETVGAQTLDRSIQACCPGGTVGLLGAIAGMKAEISTVAMLMKRVRVAGIMVDSRAAFEELVRVLEWHHIRPVIDQTFAFEALPAALRHLQSGAHFGKLVVRVANG